MSASQEPLEEQPSIDGFIDDSGNTGENLWDPVQRNLFLACLIVPVTRAEAFWSKVDAAWQIASTLTGRSVGDVELKGSHLYTASGLFESMSLADRCKIMDALTEAMITERTYVFWQGLSKHKWLDTLASLAMDPESLSFWRGALYTFCDVLHDFLAALYGPLRFRITADENSWVKANTLLQPGPDEDWSKLIDGGVVFRSSAETRGLQVVDFAVHTLYRSNKAGMPAPDRPVPLLSTNDKLAHSYVERLVDGKVLFNLMQAKSDILRAKEEGRL